MIEVIGNLWDEHTNHRADLILVTTNSYINTLGRLVMGRGAAKEARDKFAGLDCALAREVLKECGHLGFYGIIIDANNPSIGAFQVKDHYLADARLDFIQRSVEVMLAPMWAGGTIPLVHRYYRIAMNYPGIGNGRLLIEHVRPIVEQLPDNVFIYRRES